MHELAATQSVLEIVERQARAAGAKRVTAIHLIIGQLSSMVDDSVRFYWDIISQDTLCASAQLHFHRVPAQLSCDVCGQSYTLAHELIPCPVCGSSRVQVVAGDEFQVDSIEIEEA